MFDLKSYNENDHAAKTTVSGWLTDRGHTVIESGRFDIDLSVTHANGRRYAVECERRHLPEWGPNSYYPHSTVTIPARKAKFANPGAFFASVNSTCDSMVLIPAEAVTGSSLEWKETKRGREQFYHVPTGECWQFTGVHPGVN